MANKNAPKKVTSSSSKIANISNLLLAEDGHTLKVDELHLTSTTDGIQSKVVCKYVLVNGQWVLKCTKA